MSLDRREFLKALSAIGVAQALPLAAHALSQPTWTRGFDGLSGDQVPLAMQLEGDIPKDCFGTLFRNGPALYERDAQRYAHWFDPDGMIQAFHLSKDGVSHRGRFVRTRRFVEEEEAGQFLYGGAGTRFPTETAVRNNETTNVANINVQPFGDELLALWEAGSAYRIDPETLQTQGQRHWSPDLKGVPFSAHPHFDEQGDMWNIGSVPWAGGPVVVLYHIDRSGELRKSRIQKLDFAGYMHDFVLTPRYLIALNSSAVFGEGETFVDRMQWQGDRPSQLLVFDRNDFSLLAVKEVPATFVFHFGNAWEEGDRLFFTACQHPDSHIVTRGMYLLAQRSVGNFHHQPELVRYALSLQQPDVEITPLGVDMEFPSFDRRRPFAKQPIFGAGGQLSSSSSLATAVMRVDPENGQADAYDYGPDVIVEEPIFVPAGQGDGAGYLVHSLLDHKRGRSGLSLFNAGQIKAGPIAQAWMDRVMPLGFHGCFVAQRA
ncbi:MAG: carotenoid oxygenase family protein [Congregibacter sp.]